MGVATGCGFKEIYRFPQTTYPYSSCICSFFAAASLLFVHFLNVFRSFISHGCPILSNTVTYRYCYIYVYIGIFRAVCHFLNVLNVSTCI